MQMASVGPTPCSGLKSDIASPIPKAHLATVLNISPDAFATEARVVTQVVRAGSDVHRAMSVSSTRLSAQGTSYATWSPRAASRIPMRSLSCAQRPSPARYTNTGLNVDPANVIRRSSTRRGELPGYVYVTNQPRFKYQACGLCRRYRIDSPEGWGIRRRAGQCGDLHRCFRRAPYLR